jgi:5-bromo-4-chloroindolyl phosphate hydrolysis protein
MLSIVNLDEVIIACIVFGELFLIMLNVSILIFFSVGLCEALKELFEGWE